MSDIRRHLRAHLDLERLSGIDALTVSPPAKKAAPPAPAPARPVAAAAPKPVEPPPPPRHTPEEIREFEAFRAQVLACTKCGLSATRNQVVFADGPVDAPLMFIGEGPGADEDAQGLPFVGRAGQLLNQTLARLRVRRDQVYIANIVKCRPPGNRQPEREESLACVPYLLRQIRFVNPRLICLLGGVAASTLLNTKTGIVKLRGRIHELDGRRYFPTYHPAYILRNMNEKAVLEADLRKACIDAELIGK